MTDKTKKPELGTKETITWCPGCPNFMVLQAVKNTFVKLVNEGYRQEDFSMATLVCKSLEDQAIKDFILL